MGVGSVLGVIEIEATLDLVEAAVMRIHAAIVLDNRGVEVCYLTMLHVGSVTEDMELIRQSSNAHVNRVEPLVQPSELLDEKLSVQHISHINQYKEYICGGQTK